MSQNPKEIDTKEYWMKFERVMDLLKVRLSDSNYPKEDLIPNNGELNVLFNEIIGNPEGVNNLSTGSQNKFLAVFRFFLNEQAKMNVELSETYKTWLEAMRLELDTRLTGQDENYREILSSIGSLKNNSQDREYLKKIDELENRLTSLYSEKTGEISSLASSITLLSTQLSESINLLETKLEKLSNNFSSMQNIDYSSKLSVLENRLSEVISRLEGTTVIDSGGTISVYCNGCTKLHDNIPNYPGIYKLCIESKKETGNEEFKNYWWAIITNKSEVRTIVENYKYISGKQNDLINGKEKF